MDARIYFQKLKASDSLGIDTDVYACDGWGLMPTKWDFWVLPEMKDLPSNDWADEDGDDEYIPDEPKFKSFEIDVEFAYRGYDPVTHIGDFFRYLTHGGAFSIYDGHSKIGYKTCRYVKYNPEAHYLKEGKENVVRFSITFKVIDPMTKIKLV